MSRDSSFDSVVVAGTGHRPDKLFGTYSERKYLQLVKFARIVIARYPDNYEFMSGCGLGWDQALADAALDLGHVLHLAIPFDGFDARWPIASRRHFDYTKERATTTHVVCSPNAVDVIGVPAALDQRNRYMVGCSLFMLALYDGVSVGGTFNCIRHAESRKVAVDNVWQKWLKFNERNKGRG